MAINAKYIVWVVIGLIIACSSRADQVLEDDLIIQGSDLEPGSGSLCVGFDCVNGETFGGDTLRLKENNLHIRFYDTTSTAAMGQSWSLIANDAANGGASYFDVRVRSVEKIEPVLSDGSFLLSDGTAAELDCSAHLDQSNPQPAPPPTTGGSVPAGELILQQVRHITPDSGYTCGPVPVHPNYDCSLSFPTFPRPITSVPAGQQAVLAQVDPDNSPECLKSFDYRQAGLLRLGTLMDNGFALGRESDFVDGAASVGRADLLRQIKHVAEGLAETNILVNGTLNSFSPFADQHSITDQLMADVASLNAELDTIESAIAFAADEAPTAPTLVLPLNGAAGLGAGTMRFFWQKAEDPENKDISYTLIVCERADFVGCSPSVVSQWESGLVYSAMGGGVLFYFICMLTPGLRGKRWPRHLLGILAVSALLAGCNDDVSSQTPTATSDDSPSLSDVMSSTASGLKPDTTYYWKVTASDGVKTTESEVFSFSTR